MKKLIFGLLILLPNILLSAYNDVQQNSVIKSTLAVRNDWYYRGNWNMVKSTSVVYASACVVGVTLGDNGYVIATGSITASTSTVTGQIKLKDGSIITSTTQFGGSSVVDIACRASTWYIQTQVNGISTHTTKMQEILTGVSTHTTALQMQITGISTHTTAMQTQLTGIATTYIFRTGDTVTGDYRFNGNTEKIINFSVYGKNQTGSGIGGSIYMQGGMGEDGENDESYGANFTLFGGTRASTNSMGGDVFLNGGLATDSEGSGGNINISAGKNFSNTAGNIYMTTGTVYISTVAVSGPMTVAGTINGAIIPSTSTAGGSESTFTTYYIEVRLPGSVVQSTNPFIAIPGLAITVPTISTYIITGYQFFTHVVGDWATGFKIATGTVADWGYATGEVSVPASTVWGTWTNINLPVLSGRQFAVHISCAGSVIPAEESGCIFRITRKKE